MDSQDIQVDDLKKLFEIALRTTYKVKDSDTKTERFMFNCLKLFGKDYQFSVVSNASGELCAQYPSKLVILEYENSNTPERKQKDIEPLYDITKLKELFHKARFARCRARFAVPVLLFEGKHICRGATISGGAEIYGRSGFDFFVTGGESIPAEVVGQVRSEWQLFDRIRGHDILLLKQLSVGYIADLMVEKKKVKFGMNVTSSEKVDKENRYCEFTILCAPYPGCEFFKEWRENGFMAEGMKFNWSQSYVDAKLELPGQPSPPRFIDWSKYKEWDLVQLTQNYLQLFLHYIVHGESGLLIHCISGWDRTPLFISLLRLSLWADMAVHQSLGPLDILYLTVAYDWFLFGHNFPDRLSKGEEIFFFCFNFLKHITSEEFSISRVRRCRNHRTVSRTESEAAIEGLLLGSDPELHQPGYRGSNTSISSTSSLNSTKSSIDNPPVYFSVGSPEEEAYILSNGAPPGVTSANGTLSQGISNGSAAKNSPTSASRSQSQQANLRTHLMYQSTSPMAVPTGRRMAEIKTSSSVSGSWQIISGTGSVRGSASPYDSPQCMSSGSSQSDHSNSGKESSTSDCTCGGHHDVDCDTTDSPRKQRLDAVRRMFLDLYTSRMDGKIHSEHASGISGLVGNFAEKLGIKTAKSGGVEGELFNRV